MSVFKQRRGKRKVLVRRQKRLRKFVSLNKYIKRRFLIHSKKVNPNPHKIISLKKIPS